MEGLTDHEWIGIYLTNTNSSLIKNNNCSNNREAYQAGSITLHYSHNNTLSNNSCWQNKGDGSYLRESHFNVFENNSFTDNQRSGITFVSSSDNRIENNSFTDNYRGIIFLSFAKDYPESENNLVIHNRFSGNSHYGLEVFFSEASVVATHNWWGHESGPYHPEKNPKGRGDNVSDFVEFSPWFKDVEGGVFREEGGGTDHLFMGSLAVAAVMALLVLSLFLSEPLRFYLLRLPAPLYTRLNPDRIESDIAQQNIRGRIYQYIKDNPGIHLSAIKREGGIGHGTTVYHLSVLERERYLRSAAAGRKKQFWVKMDFPGQDESGLTELQRKIVEALEKFGQLSRAELRERTGIPRSTLGFNIKQLVEMGKVEEEKHGQDHVCSLKLY